MARPTRHHGKRRIRVPDGKGGRLSATFDTRAEATAESHGTMLLADFREYFEKECVEQVSSNTVREHLIDLEWRPWPDMRGVKGISKQKIASLLRPFGIQPRQWKEGTSTQRGYQRHDFVDAFERYLGV